MSNEDIFLEFRDEVSSRPSEHKLPVRTHFLQHFSKRSIKQLHGRHWHGAVSDVTLGEVARELGFAPPGVFEAEDIQIAFRRFQGLVESLKRSETRPGADLNPNVFDELLAVFSERIPILGESDSDHLHPLDDSDSLHCLLAYIKEVQSDFQDFSSSNVPISRDTWAPVSPPPSDAPRGVAMPPPTRMRRGRPRRGTTTGTGEGMGTDTADGAEVEGDMAARGGA
ncbi:hypothetical protein EHS25_003366 [Saitozyma podzolica]|uniref:Uncharacterized protein n=1 Tax=Saitozyma podzolica TaxID=1890683 RepID=A0A427Y8L7_9TREE|nr:hypothetical protein EHS25_003366 [Saitozyma podzolica]